MGVAFPKKTWDELDGKLISVFDYETDGLLDEVTKAHCGALEDPKARGVISAGPSDVTGLVKDLEDSDVLVGHNIIGFDLPFLKKVYGWEPDKDVVILDTLWMSRMFNPDLQGGHSLDNWGRILGNHKISYTPPNGDWKNYDDDMLTYCEQDVSLNTDVFNKLLDLLQHFSWESIICEMEVARIIQRQMETGFWFDYRAAERLHGTLMDRQGALEDEVRETFKPLAEPVREVQPKVKKDGTLSTVGLQKLGDHSSYVPIPEYTREEIDVVKRYSSDGEPQFGKEDKVEYQSGSLTLVEFPEFNLGSRQQIADRLLRAGYKLTKKTEKGNWIIDDAVLHEAVEAGIKEAEPLAEYFMITKREGMLKDWLKRAKKTDGGWRIHGYVNSMGAATNRMTHNSPNVAQVPSSGSPLGHECRSLFCVPYGYRLVGCDAEGLELRCLAHYMGDPEYTKAVVSGDIHWVNTLALGLVPPGTVRDKGDPHHEAMRRIAKVFIYAFLYGAGDAKIGSIIGGSAKDGKALKKKFLDNTPALKRLRERISAIMDNRSWLLGVDGRILRVRSKHAALNTLLQGMGAVVMKYWLIEVARQADALGLDWNPVANVHDEGQFEVAEKDVPVFKDICEKAFVSATNTLKLRAPCTGVADEGSNWSETH